MDNVLARPYPRRWDINFSLILKVNAIIALFVTSFLYLFKPSLIIGVKVEFTFLESITYGIISFLVPTIILKFLPILFPKFCIEDNWNVGKELVLNFSIIFFIAFFIIFYGTTILGFNFKLETALRVFWLSLLIGVVPTFGVVLFNQNRLLKNYLNSSEEINGSLLEKPIEVTSLTSLFIEIKGEGKNEIFRLDVSQFLFASSQANYCEIFYIKNDKLEKYLIRISLSNLFNQLSGFSGVEKVHRSYIANLLMVVNVSGNAQGYKLHFKHSENNIPVSRSISKKIKNKIILG